MGHCAGTSALMGREFRCLPNRLGSRTFCLRRSVHDDGPPAEARPIGASRFKPFSATAGTLLAAQAACRVEFV